TDGRVQQRFARCGVTNGFLPKAFRFDTTTNTFICPEGKLLRPRRAEERPGRTMIRYQASITDCKVCSQRDNCCSGNTRYGRSIVVRKEHPVVTAFRAQTASADGQAALRQRSAVAEFVNAWLKESSGCGGFVCADLPRFVPKPCGRPSRTTCSNGSGSVGAPSGWHFLTPVHNGRQSHRSATSSACLRPCRNPTCPMPSSQWPETKFVTASLAMGSPLRARTGAEAAPLPHADHPIL